MQKNLSENTAPKNQSKFLKYLLIGFVTVSVAAVVYKISGAPCCSSNKTTSLPAESASGATTKQDAASNPGSSSMPAIVSPDLKVKKQEVPEKRAVVYYFYTSVRCYSCKLIENYTRETVDQRFARPYKGWNVEFKGVNVELPENNHFIQDYWLNSKSVVVQKFEGEKPLNWAILKDVWQLLGDKSAFMNYVTNETRKLMDEK